jgi:hypothetical protein
MAKSPEPRIMFMTTICNLLKDIHTTKCVYHHIAWLRVFSLLRYHFHDDAITYLLNGYFFHTVGDVEGVAGGFAWDFFNKVFRALFWGRLPLAAFGVPFTIGSFVWLVIPSITTCNFNLLTFPASVGFSYL